MAPDDPVELCVTLEEWDRLEDEGFELPAFRRALRCLVGGSVIGDPCGDPPPTIGETFWSAAIASSVAEDDPAALLDLYRAGQVLRAAADHPSAARLQDAALAALAGRRWPRATADALASLLAREPPFVLPLGPPHLHGSTSDPVFLELLALVEARSLLARTLEVAAAQDRWTFVSDAAHAAGATDWEADAASYVATRERARAVLAGW